MRKGAVRPATGMALPPLPVRLTLTMRESMGRLGRRSKAMVGRGAAARRARLEATVAPVGCRPATPVALLRRL